MGLDIVETVMEVEEAFEVQIPSREAERMRTVGDLYHCLLRQLGRQAAGPCLSGVTFYRVRRALVEIGVPRQSVTPRTELEKLLPEDSRRMVWAQFRQALGPLRSRALQRPPWVFVAVGGAYVALYGAMAVALQGRHDLAVAGGVLAAGTLLSAVFVYLLTRPLALSFPKGCVTIGDVVRDLTTRNYGAVAAGVLPEEGPTPPGREREIWDSLCNIIGEQLGVNPKRITPETTWSELGAD
jgi:acyl carrier protein